jgi:hypothetical protein
MGKFFILHIKKYMRTPSRVLGSGVVAALAILFIGLPLYAGMTASPTADFGRSVEFLPLVRHALSQLHCYDVGTDECEKTSHMGNKFMKEHTLGFLLDGSNKKMEKAGFEPLYLCESRDDDHVMMVTGGLREDDPKRACRDEGFRAKKAGFISSTDDIEAPWALYRCTHPATNDTLLTHDPAECTAATYGPAELLGYLYAGGPLTLN